MDFIEQYLRFIKEAERLKAVTRTAWTHDGRRESTAEHSWRLALFAGLAAGRLPGLNREKVLMMSLIHDMGELYGGDISAALCPDPQEKTDEESRAVRKAFSLLPEREAESLLALWREYNANATPEARLVKALDKAETIIQHNQGRNPEAFDYRFNLGYGKEYFEGSGFLRELRTLLDEETAAKLHGRAGLADDLLHHAVVRVRAVLSGVKVNHVYKVCTGIEEPLCGLDRVFCYFMCSAVVTFLQAHALTVFQINRGDNSHFPTSVSFAKLRSI